MKNSQESNNAYVHLSRRIKILGVPVDAVTFNESLAWVEEGLKSPGNKRIVAVNPEKVMKARKDADLLNFLEQSYLLIPDGIGVVKAAELLGLASMERVAGSDLMPAICSLAARNKVKVFIYGSKPEVNEKSRKVLEKRFPGLQIAGWSHGYVPEKEMDELVKKINNSRAEILFVALGSPRQEKWLASYGSALSNIKISQGIGGTLDTIAGTVRRAPLLFQKAHLEWFYRLVTNPRRARRQAVLPLFVLLVMSEWLRAKLFRTVKR